MAERMTVVSADGHIGGPIEGYRPYLDPAYRDRLDDLAADDHIALKALQFHRRSMFSPGVWEIEQDQIIDWYSQVKPRLAVLDAEGIAAELVIVGGENAAPFFFEFNNPYPADVRMAGVRAYHRWATDLLSESAGRLVANADCGPCIDMAQTLAELKWVAEHGFVLVTTPGVVADPEALPPLFSTHYDPFWAACVDLGLVLNIHAGWGLPQGMMMGALTQMANGQPIMDAGLDLEQATQTILEMEGGGRSMMDAAFSLDMGPRQGMWQMMLGGVFDRFPALKLVVTEVRADWLPPTLAYLDEQFARKAPRLKLKPSEYFARNCAVTPSSPHRAEVEMRHDIGVDQFMFGADVPHPESTFPETRQWIRNAFKGVPEAETRKILGENAIRIYNLDGERFAKIAAKIGPTEAEVFAGEELTEPVLKHFQVRGGYLAPPEQIKTNRIDESLERDFARLATVN